MNRSLRESEEKVLKGGVQFEFRRWLKLVELDFLLSVQARLEEMLCEEPG